jgi:hypothetical protein
MGQSLKTPNVYRFEKDYSEVTRPAGTSTGAIVMSARQGVVNQRVLVTTDKELIDLFGTPIPDGTDVGIYAGMEFLKESDSLYVVRATSGVEEYSNIVVSGTGTISAVNSITISAADSSTFLGAHPDGNSNTINYDIDGSLSIVPGASLVIASRGPGTYGDNIGITLITSAGASLSAVSGDVDWEHKYDASLSGSVFKLSVFTKTSEQEDFDSVPAETFYCSKSYAKDGEGKQLFVEDVVNGKSKYIYVKSVTAVSGIGMIHTAGEPVALDGGADSNSYFNVHANHIDDAWELFKDKTKVDVNILIDCIKVPSTTPVISRIVGVDRMDCCACVQVGEYDDLTVENIKSVFPTITTAQSYTFLYAGWDKIYDSFNDRNVFIPKNVFGACLLARTDRIANTWDVPAGMNRGVLPSIGQNVIFSDTQIGDLYDYNINTSRFVRGVGHVMWGQKTAQRKKSALDRINVRRLLLFLENTIEPSLLSFLFEPNNSKTRLRVFNTVDSFMRTVLAGGGVMKYEVVVDETNNTAQVIDNNELMVDVYIQAPKSIEFIRLNMIVTRTGVNFSEIR